MLIYIYLNSVMLISLFLMIRMQQKMANHKYFSRITHWFGSNRKLFFTCMAMVSYKEYVQQSTSVLHPAPVNCLYLLHLRRDLSECNIHCAGYGILSITHTFPSLLLAKRSCSDSTNSNPFPSFLYVQQSCHSPEPRNLCSLLIHVNPTLWTPASCVQWYLEGHFGSEI